MLYSFCKKFLHNHEMWLSICFVSHTNFTRLPDNMRGTKYFIKKPHFTPSESSFNVEIAEKSACQILSTFWFHRELSHIGSSNAAAGFWTTSAAALSSGNQTSNNKSNTTTQHTIHDSLFDVTFPMHWSPNLHIILVFHNRNYLQTL